MTTNEADWSDHPFYKQDPFPEIEPALLNSADITRYVGKGCLLEADSFDPRWMKPASYEMRFLGELYDWEDVDGRLEKRPRQIGDGECVKLYKNSISYLWTKERLRLPEYVAARFNLRISEVHKGILLGTGPLIDPGFGGRILIPLHNLTDNDYVLRGGDGIIWVEFTKVSKNRYWLPSGDGVERPADLVPFPNRKDIDDPNVYLSKAGVLDANGVQSAYKAVLWRTGRDAEEAGNLAEGARDTVEILEKRIRKFTYWGVLGAVLSVAALLVGVGALIVSAYNLTFPVSERVEGQNVRISEIETKLEMILGAESIVRVVTPGQGGIGVEDEEAVHGANAAEVLEPHALAASKTAQK